MGATLPPLGIGRCLTESRQVQPCKVAAEGQRRRQARLQLGRCQVQEPPCRAFREGGMNPLADRAVEGRALGLNSLPNVKMTLRRKKQLKRHESSGVPTCGDNEIPVRYTFLLYLARPWLIHPGVCHGAVAKRRSGPVPSRGDSSSPSGVKRPLTGLQPSSPRLIPPPETVHNQQALMWHFDPTWRQFGPLDTDEGPLVSPTRCSETIFVRSPRYASRVERLRKWREMALFSPVSSVCTGVNTEGSCERTRRTMRGGSLSRCKRRRRPASRG